MTRYVPDDTGASLRETGSREPDPSCTGSGPSGFDPARVRDLADRCERALGHDRDLDEAIFEYLHPPRQAALDEDEPPPGFGRSFLSDALGHWGPNFTSSTDEALTLLPANWVVASLEWWPQRARSSVTMREVKDFEEIGGWGFGFDETCGDARAYGVNPALAISAAALRAHAIAMEARQGRDGETRLDPKDDSAGPKDIAQGGPA